MTMRTNVLLAWELGDGMGHVGRLLPVADRLATEGFAPVFAVRDVFGAQQRLGRSDFPVVQAPVIASVRAGDGKFFARNFADILAVIGFGDADRLRAATRSWRALVDLVRPVVVIADFAPLLTLALAGRDVPVLSVGSGFAVPPSHLPAFPEINGSGTSIVEESELLDVANRVLRAEGLAGGDALPGLVGGTAQCACTWPAFDPYARWRNSPGLGPIGPTPSPRATAPRDPSWFAYVAADSPMAKPLIDGLLASQVRGSAYVRKADSALEERFTAAGHRLHRKLPSLDEQMESASVIIHHGGINTAEAAFAMGVPQIVVSRHLEQHLTGDALRSIGAGRVVRGRFEPAQIAGMIDRTARDRGIAQAARNAAAQIGDRGGCLESVVRRALDLVADQRAAA